MTIKGFVSFAAALCLTIGTASGQEARAVLEAAAETMGLDKIQSIRYSGTGWKGALGQNYSPELNWPRTEISSYTRTTDFDARAAREELVRFQGRIGIKRVHELGQGEELRDYEDGKWPSTPLAGESACSYRYPDR